MAAAHKWTFFRAGGFDQVKLRKGEDLRNLDQLDQKLWVALACPVRGLEIDARTLELIDTDRNGRVRARELIAAARFATDSLKRPDDLFPGKDGLPLASINDATPEGKVLLSTARQIARNLGKAPDAALTVADVSDSKRIFADTPFNGDGIITELSAPDEAGKAAIRGIIETVGGLTDLTGLPGIGAGQIEDFFSEAKAYVAWQASVSEDDTKVFPMGKAGTAEAASALEAVRAKVDDFFGRCRLAAYDTRAEQALNRQEEEYLGFAAKDLGITPTEVSSFPLARISAGKALPLEGAVNPAYAPALAAFAAKAVAPALGPRKELTEADWIALLAWFAPWFAWQARKAGARVEKLGEARIKTLVASGVEGALKELLARDESLRAETAGIAEVERLVRYYRDLARLAINFVSFEDFYDGDKPAVFQAGTLYLDQRACHLVLHVEDPAKHGTMAGLAGAYLAYCDCVRGSQKMQIVAAFTAGDGDNLMVGRNGLFYDRKGDDWDATITKIIENPISIRQAFWSPYKKFVRMVEEQINKRAAAADAEAHAKLAAAAITAANADPTKPPPPPPPPPPAKKMDVGTVAAIGVAAGAIGTFATALIAHATGILRMGEFAIIGAIIGLMLLISMPSVVIAYMKLRKRNLGPILDANGWAVNSKAKINVPFGATLSSVAKLPPGSTRAVGDRYAERTFPWKTVVILILMLDLAVRWYFGNHKWLPDFLTPQKVLGPWAPKHSEAPSFDADSTAAAVVVDTVKVAPAATAVGPEAP